MYVSTAAWPLNKKTKWTFQEEEDCRVKFCFGQRPQNQSTEFPKQVIIHTLMPDNKCSRRLEAFIKVQPFFCGNCKSSDASSPRFVLRLGGSQIILNNLGFLFCESGLYGKLCYGWRSARITGKVQLYLGHCWWGTKTFTALAYWE